MSPEVLASKLLLYQEVLLDLKPHVRASRARQEDAHYEIERQVQLSVDLACAMGRRVLVMMGFPVPEKARDVFVELGKKKLLPAPLSARLASAVGLRNLIVHEYGKLDYSLFFDGLPDGYQAFTKFARLSEKMLHRRGRAKSKKRR